MKKSELIEKINGFLVEEFEVESSNILADANLREALDLDSLDYVDLVVVIESNFGVKITAEDFKTITTIQDFYDFVCSKTSCD